MALINCPECETMVSDKAFQCPKCAYPISNNFVPQQNRNSEQNYQKEHVTVNVQQSDNNFKNMLYLTSKKSEGTAYLLVILFGPFGLFYVNSDKAIKFIAYLVGLNLFFIAIFGVDSSNTNSILFIVGIIFWIICLAQVGDTIKEYNNNILGNSSTENITIETEMDDLSNLRKLIKKEKNIAFWEQSLSEEIIDLLNNNCENKENTLDLIDKYQNRFNEDLLKSLLSTTTSYELIRKYRYNFVKFGIVETNSNDRI
jgi:hypothetical protein